MSTPARTPQRTRTRDSDDSAEEQGLPAPRRQQTDKSLAHGDTREKANDKEEKATAGTTANQAKTKAATEANSANPTLEHAIRIMQSLAIYFTLIPVIVIIALKEVYFMEGLATGLACSGLLTLLHTIFWAFKLKKEPPYMLDVALLVYFTIFLAIYETKTDFQGDLQKYMNVTIHGWLAVVMLVSLAARYPWVLQHAKEVAPQVAWASRTMRAVVDQIAGAWALSQVLCSLLCVVPIVKQSTGKQPLNIVFNYVVPYLLLAILLGLTRWWPRFIRIKYYLPKMHQGAVKPGDTEAGAAGTEKQAAGAEGQQQQAAGENQPPAAPGGQPAPQAPGQAQAGQQQQQAPTAAGSMPPSPAPAQYPSPQGLMPPPAYPTQAPGPAPAQLPAYPSNQYPGNPSGYPASPAFMPQPQGPMSSPPSQASLWR